MFGIKNERLILYQKLNISEFSEMLKQPIRNII